MKWLLKKYQEDCARGLIKENPQQQQILIQLQALADALVRKSKHHYWWRIHRLIHSRTTIPGVYLWGSVGIGKTYLMDLFFNGLPIKRKIRMHFHQFMQTVHADLKRLQGEANPLKTIARLFSLKSDIICFDEFVVTDIADAMLMAGLFSALFARGVILVATSNVQPDDLYKNGLQRQRFLPMIELIKTHCDVVHFASAVDYRLSALEMAGTYYTPLTPENYRSMQQCFNQLTQGHLPIEEPIMINNREIPVIAATTDVVWFDFKVICQIPRSQNDYLEIAKRYSTVFISGVPKLQPDQVDRVTNFIHLVDVLYDARVKLVMSSMVEIDEIYQEGKQAFEFRRSKSRLHEMQSTSYLHAKHQ